MSVKNARAAIAEGRAIIESGRLRQLRQRLDLTRAAMAGLIGITPITYAQWENPDSQPRRRMWNSTASKVATFHRLAVEQLARLEKDDVDLATMVPIHVAAAHFGIPQELLSRRYRDGEVEAEDYGVLGLWMRRKALGLPQAGDR